MGASVVSTEIIVAIFGMIMPEPFAMPPTVKVQPAYSASAVSKETAASFETVSVVMMARAALFPVASSRASCNAGTPVSKGAISSCWPMMPVEATSTSSGMQPTVEATMPAVLRAFSSPTDPVAALAMPELITMARAKPYPTPSRCSRETVTGAAQNTFWVNTPAAGHSSSASTNAMSRRLGSSRKPA